MGRWVVLVCLLLAAWLLWPRDGAPGVSVVGDGAGAVRAALDLPDGASADVVLLRRAESLRHLPEVARLCRGRCGPGVTVLRVLGPGGGTRLVVEMSALEEIAALDRGEGLPDGIAACVARVVAAEAGAGRGGPGAGCAGPRRAIRVLPYGL